MHRRWLIQKTNAEYVSYLSGAASVCPAVAQILINRGIKTPHEAGLFLNGAPPSADPMGIGGMNDAIDAIDEARGKGVPVLVHGDYDADGLTATSMVVSALGKLGIKVSYFIPNRFRHGYGFNPPALDLARKVGAGLIITVDCGISSFEAAREAMAEGIKVVITDHHEPVADPATGSYLLPEAVAVVNPKLTNPELADLAGAGVALKLIEALAARYPGVFDASEFLDLAAIGTLADSVPLLGENRAIVKAGMGAIFEGRRPGIGALNECARVSTRKMRPGLIPFTLVPRINAAGRIADPTEVVELMLCTDDAGGRARAAQLAAWLNEMNYERQKIEEKVHTEALKRLEEGAEAGDAIVLADEGWHEGVIGIVASRIAERFSRPTFIFAIKGETARGSARSACGFDLYGGLQECQQMLLAFGGHRQAAGLTVRTAEIGKFRRVISEIASRSLQDATPVLNIDAAVDLREVNPRLVEEIEGLEPFGYGNPEPVLGARGLGMLYPRAVGGGKHLKMKLSSDGAVFDAIGYNMAPLLDTMPEAARVDAAFTAAFNDYNGRRTLQLKLKALRESAEA